eukprot:707435-Karenia_brevis.AAC.1
MQDAHKDTLGGQGAGVDRGHKTAAAAAAAAAEESIREGKRSYKRMERSLSMPKSLARHYH